MKHEQKEIRSVERIEAYRNRSDESKPENLESRQRQVNNEQSESMCPTQSEQG